MKKTLTKILSVVLIVVITLTSAPLSGFVGLELPDWLDFSINVSAATSGTCGENLTWNFDESTGTLTISGTGAMYENFYFTGPPWLRYANSIKTVVTNHGVTTIGQYAFYSFNNLTSVTFGDSVTTIGDYAFADCTNLTSGIIPNSVITIGSSAFYDCDSLTSITIPNSVTTIGDYAFADCTNLTSVTIGDSVTTIGNLPFVRCDRITSITVDINNKYYSNDEYGVLFNKDKTTIIQYPIGNIRKTYTIPDSVTTIGSFAFSYCNSLTSVTIGDRVTTIGYSASSGCTSLTDVYYLGAEENWSNISIDTYNEPLLNATIHYNSMDKISVLLADCEVGDVIEFGSYPQSQVTDETLILTLNSLSKTWVSYDYYTGKGNDYVIGGEYDGQMQSSDYMMYADVIYNGTKYRAVMFAQYRPYYTGYISSPDYSHQDENGYFPNTVYWFKYESLEWRVLDPVEGFVMCESIIDSQSYNNTTYYDGSYFYQDTSCTNYANDYEKSSIRDWLNEDFYDTAFTDIEKDSIQFSTQDNSCYKSGHTQYDSDTTYDKIFLLSYNESINSEYGFSPIASSTDTARKAQSTDYAKSQGLYVPTSNYYNGNSFWWLRSPTNTSGSACAVINDGPSGYGYAVYSIGAGVRPALKLNPSFEISKPGSSDDTLTPRIKFLSDRTTLQSYVGEVVEIPIVYTSETYDTSSLSIYSLYPDTITVESIEHNAGDYVCKENESKAIIKVKLKSAGSSMIVIDSVDGASNFITVTAISPLGDTELDDGCTIDGIKFEHDLDYYVENYDSSSYNPTLANMLAALSNAIYDEYKITEAYLSLDFQFKYGGVFGNVFDYYGGFDPNKCGYALSFKESRNGNDIICLVTVRGSSNLSDWIGNFNIDTLNDGKHGGFYYPSERIYENIAGWAEDNEINLKNIKYVITGHSRGAAVANLLSVGLMERGVSSKNIYNYNFACPNVACNFSFTEYKNIFNLCNREDPVPFVPFTGLSIDSLVPGMSWDKYGQTYWFTKDDNTTLSPLDDHSMSLYLEFFDQKLYPSEWGTSFWDALDNVTGWSVGTITKILCPVDVIITDVNGNKIASVINGETNYYDSNFGNVIIQTDGDKKFIFINGDADYNVELIGTDTGTMTYSVEKCNLASGEIFESKTFEDVVLEKGKTMYSPVSEAETTNDIQLFVTDEKNGEILYTHIINEDGTEEIYYNYTFSIKTPSRTEIRNKDGIILHAKVEGNAPTGSYVRWESSNGNFDKGADGSNLKIIAKNKGYTTFTAVFCDADGNELARAEVEMYSKSGFFDKIGGFFRGLFGLTKIYDK